MSLINDALKKAQRQRTNNPFGINAPMPGGGGQVAKRNAGMPAQTIMLIVAGAALLVVISAVAAVYFVNGKTTPAPTPPVAALTPLPSPAPIAPPIEFPKLAIAPVIITADSEAVAVSNPLATAAPSPAASEKKAEPAATSVTALPTVTAATPPPSMVTEDRVNAFLDTLRVTGVRAAGSSSRVLLNEKVYRVNDLVDRALGLKLTAVESDTLRFIDSNGVKYAKNF